jgi:restriction system protein
MAVPDYQMIMLPVLRLAAEGEKRVAEVEERIADEFRLTQEERNSLLPSGRQRVLHNRVHWAKFYMKKAGLISFPVRGRFVATEAGRQLLATNPSHIDNDVLKRYPAFREFYAGQGKAEADSSNNVVDAHDTTATDTPEERIEAAYQTLQRELRNELLERIARIPRRFLSS